jgi:hypothetical protein
MIPAIFASENMAEKAARDISGDIPPKCERFLSTRMAAVGAWTAFNSFVVRRLSVRLTYTNSHASGLNRDDGALAEVIGVPR